MSTISRAEVAHLADLARLALTEDELDTYAGQLDRILSSVAAVNEITGADDAPAMSHAVGLTNVFREDVVRGSLPVERVLELAPESDQDRFRVPRILGEPE